MLCEKPLAPTPRRASRVAEAEAAAGRRLVQVGFMRRYDPGYLAVKSELDAGASASRCSSTARTATRACRRPTRPRCFHELGAPTRSTSMRWLLGRGDRRRDRARPALDGPARRGCATRSSSCWRRRAACSSTSRCSPTPATATTSAARWWASRARCRCPVAVAPTLRGALRRTPTATSCRTGSTRVAGGGADRAERVGRLRGGRGRRRLRALASPARRLARSELCALAERHGAGRLMRIAILGTGRMGRLRARAGLLRSEEVLLAGRRPGAHRGGRGARAARRRDAWRRRSRAAPDGVVVASATERHAEQLQAAAELGVPVLCEKPIALTVADTRAAVDALRDAGVPVQVGFQRRFDPAIRRARRAAGRSARSTRCGSRRATPSRRRSTSSRPAAGSSATCTCTTSTSRAGSRARGRDGRSPRAPCAASSASPVTATSTRRRSC